MVVGATQEPLNQFQFRLNAIHSSIAKCKSQVPTELTAFNSKAEDEIEANLHFYRPPCGFFWPCRWCDLPFHLSSRAGI